MSAPLLPVTALVAVGCIANDGAENTRFRCAAEPRCPAGQSCIRERCVDTDLIGNVIDFDFNDGTADDGTAFAHHGNPEFGATPAEGRFGGGFDMLEDANGRLRVNDAESLYVGERGTFEIWIFRTRDSEQELFSNNGEFDVELRAGAGTRFNAGCDGEVTGHLSRFTEMPLERWAHLAVVRDESTLRFYIDGEQREESPFDAETCPAADDTLVGSRGGAAHFPGRIDELKFSDYPKTGEEIGRSMLFDSSL